MGKYILDYTKEYRGMPNNTPGGCVTCETSANGELFECLPVRIWCCWHQLASTADLLACLHDLQTTPFILLLLNTQLVNLCRLYVWWLLEGC